MCLADAGQAPTLHHRLPNAGRTIETSVKGCQAKPMEKRKLKTEVAVGLRLCDICRRRSRDWLVFGLLWSPSRKETELDSGACTLGTPWCAPRHSSTGMP